MGFSSNKKSKSHQSAIPELYCIFASWKETNELAEKNRHPIFYLLDI